MLVVGVDGVYVYTQQIFSYYSIAVSSTLSPLKLIGGDKYKLLYLPVHFSLEK